MKKEDIEKFLNRNVRIVTSNGFNYNCTIENISETAISIKDMYDNEVVINLNFIAMITPIKSKGGKNA